MDPVFDTIRPASMLKLASWNVNSIKIRLPRVLAFLEREQPDVLCLQELKTTDDKFPKAELEAAGYKAVCHGQKTYNGVAILSRVEPLDCLARLSDTDEDDQARLLGATIGPVRILTAYVPNGQAVGSDKWHYKQRWLQRLRAYFDARLKPEELVVICGDFNVAPEPRDVHDPKEWEDTVLFHPDARASLERLMDWGLVDTFRLHNQEPGKFSWWDYRMLAFQKNLGLRIDLILASKPLAARCVSAAIDRNERKGQQPSDHVPVLATFDV